MDFTAFRVDDSQGKPRLELDLDLQLAAFRRSHSTMADDPGFLALSEKEDINPLYEATDGDTYILEMKDKTGYHRVTRHNPGSFSKERDLAYFESICKEILDHAGILPRPNSLTAE